MSDPVIGIGKGMEENQDILTSPIFEGCCVCNLK